MTALQINLDEAADLADVVRRRTKGRLGELDMTQQALAARLGLKANAMSQRLKGHKDFDLNELPTLAEALNTTVEYLLGFSDDRSPRRAIGGGSLFVLPERDVLRGCRDSNPRPSDLCREEAQGAVILEFRRRSVPQAGLARTETATAVRLAEVLPLIGRVS